jgi:hypothetical protein
LKQKVGKPSERNENDKGERSETPRKREGYNVHEK